MYVVIEAVPGVAKSSYNLVTTKDFRDRSQGLVVMGEDARSWVWIRRWLRKHKLRIRSPSHRRRFSKTEKTNLLVISLFCFCLNVWFNATWSSVQCFFSLCFWMLFLHRDWHTIAKGYFSYRAHRDHGIGNNISNHESTFLSFSLIKTRFCN